MTNFSSVNPIWTGPLNIPLTSHYDAANRNMVELPMDTDHWCALTAAGYQLDALKRHLSVAAAYGDDTEVSRIRFDIAGIYALRRRLLRSLADGLANAR